MCNFKDGVERIAPLYEPPLGVVIGGFLEGHWGVDGLQPRSRGQEPACRRWRLIQGGDTPEQLAMRSGHEKTSVFRSYNIVDEADLLRAANLIEDKRQSFCTDDAQYHAKPHDLRPN